MSEDPGGLCIHLKQGRYLCVWVPGCGRIQAFSSLCVCGHVNGQVCELWEYLLTILLCEHVLGGVGACFLLGVIV